MTKWEGWKYGNPEGANTWVYRYVCDISTFEVSQSAYRALADGLVYRVYYTPESKQLVNIALVPTDKRVRGKRRR